MVHPSFAEKNVLQRSFGEPGVSGESVGEPRPKCREQAFVPPGNRLLEAIVEVSLDHVDSTTGLESPVIKFHLGPGSAHIEVVQSPVPSDQVEPSVAINIDRGETLPQAGGLVRAPRRGDFAQLSATDL